MTSRSREYASCDPFHLYEAADRAVKSCSLFAYLTAQIIILMIRASAFLPWILLVFLPILSGITYPNVTAITAACVTWIWFFCFLAQNLRIFDVTSQGKPSAILRPKVLVIGTGPTGLAVVKECLAARLSVRAYEQRETFGGVYHFTNSFDGGVWEGCRLTSSPWVTAFSDFPPTSCSDRHLTHDEYYKYLSRYVDHFGLRPHLFFSRTVVHIARHETEGWDIRVRVEKELAEVVEHFDCVAICVGSNMTPRDINIPGMDNFEGNIRHVAKYKGPYGLHGKNVVVVGNGESGVDVAAQVGCIARRTYLSIRRGKFIISRVDQQSGLANDYDTNRMRYAAPVVFRNWYMMLVRRLGFLQRTHDAVSAVGVQMLEKSAAGPMCQLVTKSDDFIKLLLKGLLHIRKEIVAFERNKVVFSDGVSEKVDEVIYAHGYELCFPFLELPKGIAVRHPNLLFMKMFMPEIGKSLAFCGFVRPAIGAIPPTAELQARYFVMVASGSRILPDQVHMNTEIQRQTRESTEMYPNLTHPTLAISWIRYLDQIADAIGCRPNPRKLFQNPMLLWKVMTGPVTGAMYRLHGPGAHPVARTTVLSMKGTHPLTELLTHFGFNFWLWPLAQCLSKTTHIQHNTFI